VVITLEEGGTTMEEMLIGMGIQILTMAVKNPTFQTQFKKQLLEVAAGIQTAYGLTPPTNPPGF
jgi:hypothetical protein